MSLLREKMIKDMKIRRLAPNTRQAYVTAVAQLAGFYKKSPDLLTDEQVQDYLFYLLEDRKLAWSSCNVAASAISFFYNHTLSEQRKKIIMPPKRQQSKLPQVLSKEEIEKLLKASPNFKHRVMLMTTYAAGLRVSELVALKPIHIESNRMLIRVDQGKGNKDRYTLLSERLLMELRDYWKKYQPKVWLFPPKGKGKVKKMSTKNAWRVYEKARRKAGIKRGNGIHSLRHTFATNLLESGVDLRTIQTLLGHKSLITTMIYLKISRKNLTSIKSPFDLIDFPNDKNSKGGE